MKKQNRPKVLDARDCSFDFMAKVREVRLNGEPVKLCFYANEHTGIIGAYKSKADKNGKELLYLDATGNSADSYYSTGKVQIVWSN